MSTHAAWWKQAGLDHMKVVTSYPALLGVSVEELQAKLSFLRDVARLSVADLNRGGPLFQASLDKKLRPRFFYALENGAFERSKLSTLCFCSDALFLRKVHQLDAPASKDEVDAYKATISSPDFRARMAAREEETRRRGGA